MQEASGEDEEFNILRTKWLLIDQSAGAQYVPSARNIGGEKCWAFVQDNKWFYFQEYEHRKFYATEKEAYKDALTIFMGGAEKLVFSKD